MGIIILRIEVGHNIIINNKDYMNYERQKLIYLVTSLLGVAIGLNIVL